MNLPRLTRSHPAVAGQTGDWPVRAIQIGEGNFIRAFVNWMIHRSNSQGLFRGSVLVTQPRPAGAPKLEVLREQEGLFTLVERGVSGGETIDRTELVSSISQCVDPYAEWETFMASAEETQIEFVFSNTTEAGVVYTEEAYNPGRPILSYPGKLTAWLFRRFQTLGPDSGVVIVPCELLPRPGDALREVVLQKAQAWQLGADFERYIRNASRFVNSLVDRIVTGYPPEPEAAALQQGLGFEDRMLVAAEPYYQWVIEGDAELRSRLPFAEAGLQVEWVHDLKPYSMRKVRILNGAHTFLVPMAYLLGHDIVRESIADERVAAPLKRFLGETVSAVLPFPAEESEAYINRTLERFANPFIDHKLLDIALNSVQKFQTRLQPTLREYAAAQGIVPDTMIASLACFIRFHRCAARGDIWEGYRVKGGRKETYELKDNADSLAAFAGLWTIYEQTRDLTVLVEGVMESEAIWTSPPGRELPAELQEGCYTQLVSALSALLAQEEEEMR
ncbi:tagaturonate reductase [Paenibacillus sp. 1P07SE]|uniref:tagaturonate reductase n=1 Tax=Paenibacillus sp. 1P07SE TaxID=3132209 RepID=UPI0039A655C0